MSGIFLNREDVRVLTGRAHRAPQIEALKNMGIPFFVNATGWAVVARAAVEGRIQGPAAVEPKKGWVPRVLMAG
jgi:hypothetical protein